MRLGVCALIAHSGSKIKDSDIERFVFICWQDEIKTWEIIIDSNLFEEGFLQRLFYSAVKPFIEEVMASEGGKIQIKQAEEWLILKETDREIDELSIESKTALKTI